MRQSLSDCIRVVSLAVSTQTIPEPPAVTSVLPSALSTAPPEPAVEDLVAAKFAVRVTCGWYWFEMSTCATEPVAPLTAKSRDPLRFMTRDHCFSAALVAYPEPGRSRQNANGPSRLRAWMNGPSFSRAYMLNSQWPSGDATPDRRTPVIDCSPLLLSTTMLSLSAPATTSYRRT